MGDYLTVASLFAGFGTAILIVRIQRELDASEGARGQSGLAWADFLLLGAALISVWLVILPLLLFGAAAAKLAGAACAAAAILLGGYLPAILGHFRIILGEERTGRRERGEPIERMIVYAAIAIAVIVFAAGLTHGRVW